MIDPHSSIGRRHLHGGLALWTGLAVALVACPPIPAQQTEPAGLTPAVVEVARTYDLAKKEEFLAVTLEITGPDAVQLRRVQPLRDDFQVIAGKSMLPCRWLRGGSLPEDPKRLRFTLGFSMPVGKAKSFNLRVNLPRLQGDDSLEIRLQGLEAFANGGGAQHRQGDGWSLTVVRFSTGTYTPPSLPPKGQFITKTGTFDARVFRKSEPNEGQPAEAMILAFNEGAVELFDPTLDVSGHLLLEGGGATPMLSASLRRVPARAVKSTGRAEVSGQFYFVVPVKGRAMGALIRFHRRPANPPPAPVLLEDLPVPGRS